MSELDWLPPHKCGLYLEHNQHLDYYQTVEEWVEEYAADVEDWVSPEELAKAIALNEVWRVHWYPKTPIGFCTMHASTLEALARHFRQGDSGGV